MSSSESSEGEMAVSMLVEVKSLPSTEDPPMEEWSSLILQLEQENEKRNAFKKGLYSPGSGELCAKYITNSDSSVFRHPYFHYPGLIDPGIKAALLDPERKKQYNDDGQELYLDLCKEANQCPVRLFHRNLLTNKIDLKYYCIDPFNVRAMSMVLYLNRTVRILDLTDNFLNFDACFHLGEMLKKNYILQELILNGCRIGNEGAKIIINSLADNMFLISLDLSRNQLDDDITRHVFEALDLGIPIKKLILRNNKITSYGADQLAKGLVFHNNISYVDMSWNLLYSPVGVSNLINSLFDNIQELRLANDSLYGPRVANAIKHITSSPNLSLLDISNNMFTDDDISMIISNLIKARNLHTLNLSSNPMCIKMAIQVLSKLKLRSVTIQNLFLDNIDIDQEFMTLLEEIKNIKFRKNTVITHGRVLGTTMATRKDPRDVILNRAEFLCNNSKREKVDLALLMLGCLKERGKILADKDFEEYIKHNNAPLDKDLVNELTKVFPGPKTQKSKTVNMWNVVEYVKRKWPEKTLPPSPKLSI